MELNNLGSEQAKPHVERVIFLCRAPIESGLANIVQSLQMAKAMSSFKAVSVFAGTRNSIIAEERIKDILGKNISVDIVLSTKSFFFRVGQLISHLVFKRANSRLVITRSALAASCLLICRQRVLLEFHSTTLSSNTYLTRWLSFFLKTAVARKIFIVAISNALSERLFSEYGIKTDLVLHDAWANRIESLISPAERGRRKHLVVYTGKISLDRGMKQIFLLAEKDPGSFFLIVGGSKKECMELRELIWARALKNIKVYPYQRASRIAFLQGRADILIAFWSHSVSTIEYCSPLKLFEYMSTGNKILIHDFKVFHEVLIESPLLELCVPGDHQSEFFSYGKLKSRVISSKDVAEMKAYSARFSYENRAKILLDKVGCMSGLK